MSLKQILEKQFDDLITEGERIAQERPQISPLRFNVSSDPRIEQHNRRVERFYAQSRHLAERICGDESAQIQRLIELEGLRKTWADIPVTRFIGVLEAIKLDFEAGMFDDIRSLVRADVLDDFLSQAEELLSSGFSEASVSLGGAILEDTLRKLCDKHSITRPTKTTIDGLNVMLVKAQVYDGLVQKRITQLAHLRNDADHGRSLGTVKPADAEDMLKWVRRFVTDYLN
jgi:hypothetical protein